jgi:hypothetical protein
MGKAVSSSLTTVLEEAISSTPIKTSMDVLTHTIRIMVREEMVSMILLENFSVRAAFSGGMEADVLNLLFSAIQKVSL